MLEILWGHSQCVCMLTLVFQLQMRMPPLPNGKEMSRPRHARSYKECEFCQLTLIVLSNTQFSIRHWLMWLEITIHVCIGLEGYKLFIRASLSYRFCSWKWLVCLMTTAASWHAHQKRNDMPFKPSSLISVQLTPNTAPGVN